jgi:Arc/MetJ family transcription regulator
VYRGNVRTNIEIDDDLLAEAQAAAGTDTKRATVHYALQELVRRRSRQRILDLRGRVDWVGDLDQSRRDRIG